LMIKLYLVISSFATTPQRRPLRKLGSAQRADRAGWLLGCLAPSMMQSVLSR
jgi:hypothetical protein